MLTKKATVQPLCARGVVTTTHHHHLAKPEMEKAAPALTKDGRVKHQGLGLQFALAQ